MRVNRDNQIEIQGCLPVELKTNGVFGNDFQYNESKPAVRPTGRSLRIPLSSYEGRTIGSDSLLYVRVKKRQKPPLA